MTLKSVRHLLFRPSDGAELRYRAWLPARPAPHALVLLHARALAPGGFGDLVHHPALDDVACFACPDRGGDAGFSRRVRDAADFAAHLAAAHGFDAEDLLVVGRDLAAVAAATWAHDYAPRLRGLVLMSPALAPRRAAGGVERATRRIVADAGAIRVPTLLLSSPAEGGARRRAQRRFHARLGAAQKELATFDAAAADGTEAAVEAIKSFVVRRLEAGGFREPLLDAHRRGYTFEELERLRAPLPALSPRRLAYALQRLVLATVGRLSAGIRLGHESGFDSGRTLDYVYENRPRGRFGIGRWIDRAYLDAPGWRGIRARKTLLRGQIERAIRHAAGAGTPVRVLDVATGCGRYVLEAMARVGRDDGVAVDALLRDYRQENLEAGRKLAAAMGLDGVRFELADAFDPDGLAGLRCRFDVAIVSGLYELFADNDAVLGSLRGVAAALRADGRLVYTGQPWHPQLEMIARVLTNREGEPWVMRRRTQEEMDDLVRAAGLRKTVTEIDPEGIFTVSTACREAAAASARRSAAVP